MRSHRSRERQPGSKSSLFRSVSDLLPSCADPKLSLDQLPNEVVLHIWTHLYDPESLAETNKRFRELSKDTLWRARWLMQRYDCYEVIFEAIARPKLFTVELFEQLIRLKAPCSRELVQHLHILYNQIARECVSFDYIHFAWSESVRFSAYSAVMQHGVKLVSVSLQR